MKNFDGDTYDPAMDGARLSGQLLRVRNLMEDGQWRGLDEIVEVCGGTVASISARLRDFRKEKFGGHIVNRKRVGDGKSGYYHYQLVTKELKNNRSIG